MGKPIDRTVTIQTYRDHSAELGVRFEMFDDFYDSKTPTLCLRFSKDDVKDMRKSDFHRVTFRLNNNNGLQLKFASDKKDALWVVESTNGEQPDCPKTKPANGNTALKAEKVKDHELIAHNSNNCSLKFSFALNFVDAADVLGTQLIPFDPGGVNTNGGQADDISAFGISSNVVVGAVAATALLAVAFVFLR